MLAERLAGFREGAPEQDGVEEVLVGLSRLHTEPGQVGEALQREVIGHLAGKLKIRGHPRHQVVQEWFRGELVINRIDAHGPKCLRVFGKAVPFKPRLRETTAVAVTLLIVNLPAPARILP